MQSAGTTLSCILAAWRNHESELRRFLVHRLADAPLAEDLLQEVFLKAVRQGLGFCDIEDPRAWLFRVARNALVDHARLAKPLVPLPDDLPQAPEEEPAPVDRLSECLRRVLTEIPAEDAEILRKCDLEGMKQKDFADAHGLGLPAAKSRLLRARSRLREIMTAKCQVSFDESGKVCCHVPRGPA
ncbi:MAG: sigma-70 family RNA polymerase sigma factor [Betaproteobacteria bacterium]|nr:sigma-70 family RNA polymerase sigma factor [Betaproteobacteria bacterium]